MDADFLAHVRALKPQLRALLSMSPASPGNLPKGMPKAGVYLFTERGRHLYVGRSNNIRSRIGGHCRPGSQHNAAAFAFRLARAATSRTKATYRRGDGSRAALMQDPEFFKAFTAAKTRVRRMQLRFVEEADPTRQALLEVYVALAVGAAHNDFDDH